MSLKKSSVLIVDDDPDVLTAVKLLLKTETAQIVTEKNPENLNSLLHRQNFDLILLDMNFNSAVNTGNEGLYWLRKIQEWKPGMRVIMITAYGDIDLAIRSLKDGATDFIVKPWHNEKLLSTLQAAVQDKHKTSVKSPSSSKNEGVNIIGQSEAMESIFHKIDKVAATDANILILGENGTGKDLVAQAIHEKSARAKQPFIKVDVGALTDTLFESELFGHKKGAFTDAREDRAGRFEAAHGGTLFLDEIGNISLQQQAKLLSVLQNRQVIRLGTNQPIPVDIRLVCATNMPLYQLADEGRFRKDLIYRINTVEMVMPPLRQRGHDVVLLADHYLRIYAQKYGKSSMEFSALAMQKLQNYPFPGNVRELQHTIERAVIMADQNQLTPPDLVFSSVENPEKSMDALSGPMELNQLEKNAILHVIEKHNGNITRAAKELGITRTALYRRLSKHDI
ncbi:MAG: sigma-54-dependent Fis family transcriptional regulator [Mucilaginibacter polytrichastri]|nr:sigma-54-dependent Fis family transcriptional regulator [Mucilaginibacter polytrichastri]